MSCWLPHAGAGTIQHRVEHLRFSARASGSTRCTHATACSSATGLAPAFHRSVSVQPIARIRAFRSARMSSALRAARATRCSAQRPHTALRRAFASSARSRASALDLAGVQPEDLARPPPTPRAHLDVTLLARQVTNSCGLHQQNRFRVDPRAFLSSVALGRRPWRALTSEARSLPAANTRALPGSAARDQASRPSRVPGRHSAQPRLS